MALKHFTRIQFPASNSAPTCTLIDVDGQRVDAYDTFEAHLVERGHAYTTRKRYGEAVARFLDYLTERGVFGNEVSNSLLNVAVSQYPGFLRIATAHPDPGLSCYAQDIGFHRGIVGASAAPTLAAINRFLVIAQDKGREASELWAQVTGAEPPPDLRLLIKAVDGKVELTPHQRRRIRENSVLGAVVRMNARIERPAGLSRSPQKRNPLDLERLDFPLQHVRGLIDAATSWRDRTFWLGIGAAGLRPSEMLNLRLSDIDVERQVLWVQDPELRRYGRQMTGYEVSRFKGRTMSRTYLFEPLRSAFFDALRRYLEEEFVPTDKHNYLLQKLDRDNRGAPLAQASDTARNNAFKAAVVRAGIAGPPQRPEHCWTQHSLRHMYGVYMLNYLPIPNGYGLRITEVQMLMGHADVSSTMHYARHDAELVRAKLEYADRHFFDTGLTPDDFPHLIADRLRHAAQTIEASNRTTLARI
jgi:integrase